MCRSRRELSNEYLVAKFGFDKAENELSKVCRSKQAIVSYPPPIINLPLVTLDGKVMESTYVHAESSDTVNVLFVAVVDEYTLNVDWRIWSDVAQPNAKVPLLKCCVRPESWLNEPSDTSLAELYPAASHRDTSPPGI